MTSFHSIFHKDLYNSEIETEICRQSVIFIVYSTSAFLDSFNNSTTLKSVFCRVSTRELHIFEEFRNLWKFQNFQITI